MQQQMLGLSLQKMAQDYSSVIKYLIRNSDTFTLVMHMVSPYSKNPNPCREIAFSSALEPFLIRQTLNAREWPFTRTNGKHLALCRYRCCRAARDTLLGLPCLFERAIDSTPVDLCLYRDNACWFAVVLHEEWAFAINPTDGDRDALERFSGLDKPYFL